MKEEWKDIKGFEGAYQVSNHGNIKGLNREVATSKGLRYTIQGKSIKPYINKKNGYCYVDLQRSGKRKNCLVHRLAADAFIENKNQLGDINHKDEDKTNNDVTNLEWCDRKYNINYGQGKYKAAKTRNVPVKKMSRTGTFIKLYNSIKEAQVETGIKSASNIIQCAKGKVKTAGGFRWEYYG